MITLQEKLKWESLKGKTVSDVLVGDLVVTIIFTDGTASTVFANMVETTLGEFYVPVLD